MNPNERVCIVISLPIAGGRVHVVAPLHMGTAAREREAEKEDAH